MSHSAPERHHHTWLTSDRPVPAHFVRPLLRFTHIASSGGIMLIVAAITALLWANLPVFGESYQQFWNAHLTIDIGLFQLEESLEHLVNDGLMAIFFFVVGLEIKRELIVGDLADPKQAALPAIAAVGGMAVPALIYVPFTASVGGEAVSGWGIPMATEIAFALGVVSLLGKRVPIGAKLFLLGLAIADDIGAIAVIAIFYTSELWLPALGLAAVGLGLIVVSSRVGIRSTPVYVALAVMVWFLTLESGLHASLAGVTIAFLTPLQSLCTDDEYNQKCQRILAVYDEDAAAPRAREQVDFHAMQLSRIAYESISPLDRLEAALHGWSAFVILPLFALANAGVVLVGVDLRSALTSPVSLGVAFGLVVGKVVGVTLATAVALRTGIGRLPPGTTWRHVVGLSALAGIGFTVSLFVTELAFTDTALANAAKIGIFVASTVAGLIGYAILRGTPPIDEPDGASVGHEPPLDRHTDTIVTTTTA